MESRTWRPVLDEVALKKLCVQSHFETKDYASMRQVNATLRRIVMAKAWFHLEEDGSGATWIVTLGEAVDQLEEDYQSNGEFLKSYQLQCIAMALLEKSYQELGGYFTEHYGKQIRRYCFPGSELPLIWMDEALKKSGQSVVHCNEAYMLLPKKSVVFYVEFEPENVGETGGNHVEKQERLLCQNCNNLSCQNRRNE